MKRLLLIPLILFLVTTGCEKDPETRPAPTTPIQPPTQIPNPPTIINKAPFAATGSDMFFVLPTDSCILSGSAWDENNDIEKYVWKQISGMTNAAIETPDSLITKVRNLKKGNYKFELLVTDKKGLTAKDTAHVTVLEIGTGTNETGLTNLKIQCPWDCSVMIENFSSLNPENLRFNIYVKKSQDSSWIAIKQVADYTTGDKYLYDIIKNNLWIYAENEAIVDVKINF